MGRHRSVKTPMPINAPLPRKWLFWLALALLFFLFLYAIKAILLPFIVGMLVAYFLDPAADRLEKWGASRTMATTLITFLFFGILAFGLVLLIPVIISQTEGFVRALPGYIEHIRDYTDRYMEKAMSFMNEQQIDSAREAVASSSESVAAAAGAVVTKLLSSGMAFVNLISLIVLTPIVSFYLLRDWDRIIHQLDTLLPRHHADTIRTQVGLIDDTIAGFVRGTVNVMIVLGTFYAISLSFVGLNFAVLIGILGGIMIIIPYLGTFISGAAAVGMAYLQFESPEPVVITFVIFVTGQILEGYVLTPKLVGDKIGLHPLWLIFGMLAGAALFGFVGVLIAIPVTAVIGVLTRFAIQQYKSSDYYQPKAAKKKTVAKPS